jgi:hypothetical protein
VLVRQPTQVQEVLPTRHVTSPKYPKLENQLITGKENDTRLRAGEAVVEHLADIWRAFASGADHRIPFQWIQTELVEKCEHRPLRSPVSAVYDEEVTLRRFVPKPSVNMLCDAC